MPVKRQGRRALLSLVPRQQLIDARADAAQDLDFLLFERGAGE